MKNIKKIREILFKIIIFCIAILLILIICQSVKRSNSKSTISEYEYESIQKKYIKCSEEYDNLQDKYEKLDSKYEKLSKEYESYKAEKETTKKYDENSANKEDYNTGITFDNLARTPNDYEGKRVKFTGKVLQIVESDTEINIRLAIDEDYDKIIYLMYEPNIVSSRVLENDTITIYGISCNLYTYTSTLGKEVTIPLVYVTMVEQ